jgi:hypothetical protein
MFYPDQEDTKEVVLNNNQSNRIVEIMQIFEDDDFHRFVPGYVLYQNDRIKVKEAYLHGTGSYALRRILVEGLSANKRSSRLSGEDSALNNNSDTRFVSLADSNKRGESIARAYAFSSSSGEAIGFNSDSYFELSRIQRLLKDYGGIDNFVEYQVSLFVNSENIQSIEEYRRVFLLEAEFLLEYGLGYGNYVFSVQRATNEIDELKRVLDMNDQELHLLESSSLIDIRKVLFKANILRNKLDKDILNELDHLVNSGNKSWLWRKIDASINHLESSIERYKSRDQFEREELENQFPVVLLIDGEGIEFEKDKLAIIEEKRTKEIINSSRFKEIRVPQEKISEVRSWLDQLDLDIVVSPLEFFEVNEVVESTLSH